MHAFLYNVAYYKRNSNNITIKCIVNNDVELTEELKKNTVL